MIKILSVLGHIHIRKYVQYKSVIDGLSLQLLCNITYEQSCWRTQTGDSEPAEGLKIWGGGAQINVLKREGFANLLMFGMQDVPSVMGFYTGIS